MTPDCVQPGREASRKRVPLWRLKVLQRTTTKKGTADINSAVFNRTDDNPRDSLQSLGYLLPRVTPDGGLWQGTLGELWR